MYATKTLGCVRAIGGSRKNGPLGQFCTQGPPHTQKSHFGPLKKHQNALKCLKNHLCGESHATCDWPHRRFLRHFKAFWGLFGPQRQGRIVVSVRPWSQALPEPQAQGPPQLRGPWAWAQQTRWRILLCAHSVTVIAFLVTMAILSSHM